MPIIYNMQTQPNRFNSWSFILSKTGDNKTLVICSGIAIINFSETRPAWKRDTIELNLDIRFAVPTGKRFKITGDVPYVSINSSAEDDGHSVCAVDSFDLSRRNPDGSIYSGGGVTLTGAVACYNANLARIGFHLTLIGDVEDMPPDNLI